MDATSDESRDPAGHLRCEACGYDLHGVDRGFNGIGSLFWIRGESHPQEWMGVGEWVSVLEWGALRRNVIVI